MLVFRALLDVVELCIAGVVLLLVVGAALLVLIVGQNLVDIMQKIHQDDTGTDTGLAQPLAYHKPASA